MKQTKDLKKKTGTFLDDKDMEAVSGGFDPTDRPPVSIEFSDQRVYSGSPGEVRIQGGLHITRIGHD